MAERPIPAAASTAASSPPLAEIARVARLLRAEDVIQKARELATRLSEGRFYVACVGQFKRGKSTLLNALVGERVLPTGVAPVTSVVTVLRYGDHLGARVMSEAGTWVACVPSSLSAYVSENENPGNRKGIRAVEVFVPCPLLSTGLCLVDTPGVGSVFEENTAATHAFVPHVDAALVVLGADPPVSAPELRLFGEIASRVENLIVVLSKADRVPEGERREAIEFCERLLRQRLGRPIAPALEVSATERLTGEGPPRQWPELVAALEGLAVRSGADLVRAAERRGVLSLRDELGREIRERREALLRPVSESQVRIQGLKRAADKSERGLFDLGALLSAEQARISRRIAEDHTRFFEAALVSALRASGPPSGELRHRGAALAIEIARRWIDRWRAELQPAAEELYRGLARRFAEMAVETQATILAAEGAEDVLLVGQESGLPIRSRYDFTEMLGAAPESSRRRLVDWLRTSSGRTKSIEGDAVSYLERLFEVNGARIRNDFDERILESRRRLEGDVRRALQSTSATAERSLQLALQARRAGDAAIKAELTALDGIEAALAGISP